MLKNKNKIKIITILTVIILALTLPIVRAENETNDDAENPNTITAENVSDENTSNEATEPTDFTNNNSEMDVSDTDSENFKRSDIYLTGDDVTIDYIIDGNLFVFANHVTINSQIGGDALICADTITIGDQGYVFSNLFAFAKNVTIDGVVYDLYSASESTNINGYVYRDIRVGSNTVNISGTIGRNAYIDCANLNFVQNTHDDDPHEDSQGIINGNLKYSAKQEASIPEGAVTGETTFEKETSFNGNTLQDQIMSLATILITVVVIWLLCLWLAPKFLKNNSSLLTTKKILPVIGFGILTPIASIIVAILLFILGATSKLALLLIIILVILMMISTSIFIIAITNVICEKLKIEKTGRTFSILVMTTIVLWILNLIPFVNSLVGFVSTVLGFGIVVSSLVLKDKTDDIV